MQRFMAGQGMSPNLSKGLKYISAIFLGCLGGYMSSMLEWQSKKPWCNDQKLVKYECQDQINTLINETNKPAVIYYYLPFTLDHYMFRRYMFKYSHQSQAHFVMVNLTKKLQMAKQALNNIVFPVSHARIQVRYPKSQLAIFEGDQQKGYKLIRQCQGHRRQVYTLDSYQQQFRAFLQQNKIIKGYDPTDPVLDITRNALFK